MYKSTEMIVHEDSRQNTRYFRNVLKVTSFFFNLFNSFQVFSNVLEFSNTLNCPSKLSKKNSTCGAKLFGLIFISIFLLFSCEFYI